MKKLLTLAAVVVATPLSPLSTAIAAEDLRLSARIEAAKPGDAHLTLVRKQGRYALEDASKVRLTVDLAADVGQGSPGERIVASELELKDAGSGAPVSGVGLSGSAPVSAAKAAADYEFRVDPTGILAQNAAAACGSAATSGKRVSANVTVQALWRVTTGRFTFSFVNYDRVAPVEGIKDNPDYYGERQTHVKEIAVPLTLDCVVEQAPAVAETKPAKASNGNAAEAKTEPSKAKANANAAPAKPQTAAATSAPRVTVEPDTAAAQLVPVVDRSEVAQLPAAAKPVCEGGMIRETSADAGSFICLCPGNTQRASTGPNAYACQKAARR